MRSIFQKFGVVLFFLIIAGCARTQQSGGTVADARLQTDVMRMIGIFESAAGGSNQPKLISATNTGNTGSTVIENWVVDSNSKKVTYEVKLTPSPEGGVDFVVTRLRAQ